MRPTNLTNASGERLDHVFTPGRDGGRELAIIGHGVTSSLDRPYFADLCDAFAEVGIASLRFSFAGNGESQGRFEECTISKEVQDLGSVLDGFDGWRVAYIGHSMGGAVGVLRTGVDERIGALVSLAGMSAVQAFMERVFGELVPGRDLMLGREGCPLTQRFLDDARAIGSVVPQGAEVRVPWRLVHGTHDELVPLEDSVRMVEASEGRAELVELAGADHRFTDRHEDLVEAVVPWVARVLR